MKPSQTQAPIPLNARPLRVDRAGRLTLPLEMRKALKAGIGAVWGWWDGTRLHLASHRDLQAYIDGQMEEETPARPARGAKKRKTK